MQFFAQPACVVQLNRSLFLGRSFGLKVRLRELGSSDDAGFNGCKHMPDFVVGRCEGIRSSEQEPRLTGWTSSLEVDSARNL